MAVASKKTNLANESVAPQWYAKAREIQKFGTVIEDLSHALDAKVRADMVAQLNQLLADSIVLRDIYKKHHWQVSSPTFINFTCSSISTSMNRWKSSTRLPSAFSCLAG